MRTLLGLASLAVAAVAVWWLFFRKNTGIDSGVQTTNTDDKKSKTSGNIGDPVDAGCFHVPREFPKFQPLSIPDAAKSILGISDADWTTVFQDRLLGWFIAIDVAPSDYVLNYYGKELIMQYLNSPVGIYPSNIVVKGSARCDLIKTTKTGGYFLN